MIGVSTTDNPFDLRPRRVSLVHIVALEDLPAAAASRHWQRPKVTSEDAFCERPIDGNARRPAHPNRRGLIEAVVASTVGTTIEWYDFFLYGTAAAAVFPASFFPSFDPFAARMLSFSTFTVGFVARPVGGAFFGYLGDRVGRKSTLVATLLLMGVSTFLIGLLPTYAADRPGGPGCC